MKKALLYFHNPDKLMSLTGLRGLVCVSLLILMSASPSAVVQAAPSGSDLLQACTQSMQHGFDDMVGKMCTWYVTPCDCKIDKGIPLVCLPEEIPTSTLASLVIDGLKAQPELQQLDATRAAATILSAKYPCAQGQQE